MSIPQIILVVLLALIVGFIGYFILSTRAMDRRARKFDTVGTTIHWARSKIPFIGRIVIEYTKKGKPYQAASNFMLKPRKLKIGAKNRWTIFTYHIPNKAPFSQAKRYKSPKTHHAA